MSIFNNTYNFIPLDLLKPFEFLFDFNLSEDSLEKEFNHVLNHRNEDTDNRVSMSKSTKQGLEFKLTQRKQDYTFLMVLSVLICILVLGLNNHDWLAGTLVTSGLVTIIKDFFNKK